MNLKQLRLIYINYIMLMMYTIYGIITKVGFREYAKTFSVILISTSTIVVLLSYVYETIFPKENEEVSPAFDQIVGDNSSQEIDDLLEEMNQSQDTDKKDQSIGESTENHGQKLETGKDVEDFQNKADENLLDTQDVYEHENEA